MSTTIHTAPTGTDPRDREAWKPIKGIVIDHPRVDPPLVRVLDDTPRAVSAARGIVMHHETLHGSFVTTWPLRLSPLTQAIIAAAVPRG